MSGAFRHPIVINPDKCVGCVRCMTACPTKAVRVRRGRAVVFKDLCIDCGECIRSCPHDALDSRTTAFADMSAYRFKVAIPATTLYGQFEGDPTPAEVLAALRGAGFDHVYELSTLCELHLAAFDEYLVRHPKPRPLISTTCPVIVRLIQRHYPSLVELPVPMEPPREVAAKILRAVLPGRLGLRPEEIGIIHVTPCPAKIVSINDPLTMGRSNLNGAVSIRDLYPVLQKQLRRPAPEVLLDKVFPETVISGLGIGWSLSGGEARGLRGHRTIAVSGVRDSIQVLDQLEAGQINDLDFLECTACPDGCVGGPLAVEDRFRAKSRILRLIDRAGEKTVLPKPDEGLDELRRFLSFEQPIPRAAAPVLDPDPARAIDLASRREALAARLPAKDCGACGAPDCRTLAEDIARGRARIEDCPFPLKEAP